jgi:hypothetical protein
MRLGKLKILGLGIILGVVLFNTAIVYAQSPATTQATTEPRGIVTCGRHLPSDATEADKQANECTIGRLFQMVFNIINLLLSWAWLVATIMIVWAGWGMVNAGGNEEAVSEAKTTLTNAIIGFFLVLASFVLLNFIVSLITGEGTLTSQKILEAFDLIP